MLRNLVNAQDLISLANAFRSGRILRYLERFTKRRSQIVQDTWDTTQNPPVQLWDIPAVHRRMNQMITGDPEVDYITYVSRKYLAPRIPLTGLSLGCGVGQKELTWASHCEYTRLDAYDLAPQRIAAAQKQARTSGATNVHFLVGDVYRVEWPARYYDVVFSDQSLHHFTPLDQLLARIRRVLKPDGYLILNEFVGPTRFQWTDRQLEVINGVLAILPPRYRVRWADRKIKRRVHRPSRLSMVLSDPSEAVEAGNILPLVEQYFEIVERRDYGGTVLHMLFADIAANFINDENDEEETNRLLALCFQIEDALLESGELSSDFALMVCRLQHTETQPVCE
jgi:ubiquinone/menaquinone biosynthesis C-methylase UbiE